MNCDKLLGLIKEKGDTQESLAKAIGLSRTRLSAKIHQKAAFTHPEIIAIKRHYNLSTAQIDEIFFSDIVS